MKPSLRRQKVIIKRGAVARSAARWEHAYISIGKATACCRTGYAARALEVNAGCAKLWRIESGQGDAADASAENFEAVRNAS